MWARVSKMLKRYGSSLQLSRGAAACRVNQNMPIKPSKARANVLFAQPFISSLRNKEEVLDSPTTHIAPADCSI
jgi:hypothetical protein